MEMNRIQFQAGMSMPVFFKLNGTEPQCEAALFQSRWHVGFAARAVVMARGTKKTRGTGLSRDCSVRSRDDAIPATQEAILSSSERKFSGA